MKPNANDHGARGSTLPPRYRLPPEGSADVWFALIPNLVSPTPRDDFLTAEEEDRAERFRFAEDRDRFVARRWLVRLVLAEYLERSDPAEIRLGSDDQGRPELVPQTAPAIHFNLSATDELVAVGVSRHGEIGVDVERVREVSDAGDIVERHFTANERSGFRDAGAGDRASLFVDLWTRKEALLKARGSGLTVPLDSVEVSVPPDDPRVVRIPGEPGEEGQWTLRSLPLPRGFAGTLALRHPDGELRFVGWW